MRRMVVLFACACAQSPMTPTDGSVDALDAAFAAASHRPFPQITMPPGGRVMNNPTLVTIIPANENTTGDDSAANLRAFSDFFPTSNVWDAMAKEYGVGHLTSSPAQLQGAAMSGSYTMQALRDYVTKVLADQSGPMPNGNTIYQLYLPDGATLGPEFGGTCGYHINYPSETQSAGDQISLVQRCAVDVPTESKLGHLTLVASHEIVESATNPAGRGYALYSSPVAPGSTDLWSIWNGGTDELGDPCEGTRTFENAAGAPSGGWEMQREWSNAAAKAGGDPCVPSAKKPYFSVTTAQDWYPIQPGGSVTISFTGWSAAPVENWFLNRDVSTASPAFKNLTMTLSSDLGILTAASCGKRYAINNGLSGSLTVSAPASAQSGDYAVLRIDTFLEEEDLCNPYLQDDQLHFWPVGVYVP